MAKMGDISVRSHKIIEKKYDDKEDATIKEVAEYKYKSNNYSKIIFCILIMTLGFSIANLFISINSYQKSKTDFIPNENAIKIQRYKDNILIINNGIIDENITNDSYDKDGNYKIERIVSIQIESYKNGEDSNVQYNLKYNILENEFNKNAIPNNDSEVVVRYSYSYDLKEWNYINNVISTSESTINPLMGKTYDISGIKDNLKVATKAELKAKDGESNIIYWKSETIFKNKNNKNINKNFKVSFKIEYIEN